MMSQQSSCGFSGYKKDDVVLTTEDIPEEMVRPFLPLVGCPDCRDHQKVVMKVSGSAAHPNAYYVKCERYKSVYEGKKCTFYKWLHGYGLYLQSIGESATLDLIRRIEELHRDKVARLAGEVNSVHSSEVIGLEGELREVKLQEKVNRLQNEKKIKELEAALKKANSRGTCCFMVFLWFISVCFTVFVGCAMEAGKKD